MLLKTILNQVRKFPSHVYDAVRLVGEGAHTSWDTVARALQRAVDYGYQIDAEGKRLLWIGQGRHEKTLEDFFQEAKT